MHVKKKVANYVTSAKENEVISSEQKTTPRPYPDYTRLPEFHYLPLLQTPTNDRTPDDFQPRVQIKRKFEAGKLKCGDSEAIKKFSNEYIVPEKLVTDYVDHLAQIGIRKEKKKAEITETVTTTRIQRY